MIYVLTAFCLVGAIAIVMPAAATLRAYRRLPLDVPEHFDGYGRPDAMGPRPMIFASVAAQLIAAGIWAIFLHAWFTGPAAGNGVIASGFAADGLLLTLAWMQSKILNVALGHSERIQRPFQPMLALLSGIALAVLSATLLR